MTAERISYELVDGVALLRMDDGKANALSHEMLDGLAECLQRASGEAGAVVLAGREGRFSAGFDLSVMTAGPREMGRLVVSGAERLMQMYLHPRPVVVACTGHALAAGALLLLAADRRIGAAGPFKIGLNEVAIQMTLPLFALELARDRLCKRHLTRAVTQATIYDPDGAGDAGYLDTVVPAESLLETALAEARTLAALPDPAFRNTKEREREETVRRIRDHLEEDIASLGAPRK